MKKILVTGGCGYIGTHTVVDLIENGFDVISIDNNSKSDPAILKGVEEITGRHIKNHPVDLCNFEATRNIFSQHKEIEGVIHFAAYKSVPESVNQPLLYYHNNIESLVNILKCINEFKIPNFVFSSSCSVYGNADDLPVTEETPLKNAESPYGKTKQMGEQIIKDYAVIANTKNILLRYFNPVGAHESGLIGENPIGTPENLVPYITQTAIGKREQLTIFGGDYSTRDGSCIRDYIHVMDIAHAHTKALQYLIENRNNSNCEIFNLGTGNGVSVLEAVKAFEKVSGEKLNYTIGPRRPGDVEAIFANNEKAATQLNWKPKRGIEESMETAWKWEKNMAEGKVLRNEK